jgi:LacI family transcriptional regulator
VAQALRGVRTRSIGVVTNYFSNIYFRDFYIGLEKVADAHRFFFIVSQAYESLEKEKRQVAKFSEYGVDGLIVLPCSREREHLLAVSEMGIPVVLISNILGTDFASVIPDNIRGTKMAVDSLLRFDKRPIFHIAGPQEQSAQRQRLETYIAMMRKERPWQAMDTSVYKAKGLRSLAGYAAREEIMREHTPPFSLFVCNDETATGVISYAAEHNLRLPVDVAIACFSGDTSFTTMGVPVNFVMVQAKPHGRNHGMAYFRPYRKAGGKNRSSSNYAFRYFI